MGKLKTFFLACLGIGIAAGAGFYLYRKFTSTDEEEGNSAKEVTTEKPYTNLNQHLKMKLKIKRIVTTDCYKGLLQDPKSNSTVCKKCLFRAQSVIAQIILFDI